MSESIKEKKNSKPHINIGTIGHVDDGKTTLAAAITKYLSKTGTTKFIDYGKIDKAPEEKKRGITITSSHIEIETEDRTDDKGNKINGRHYSVIDCPGHADYVKNMITGTVQMDEGAILVVNGEKGSQEQTKEHLRLAYQIGIRHLVVFINKIDLVKDPEMLELVEVDIRENLTKFGFDGEKTPIIKGSALAALNENNPEIGEKAIKKLLEAIDSYIPTPQRDTLAPFLMPIADNNYIKGRGTVATGKPKRGTLKKGEEVEIVGLGPTVKVKAISMEMHHKNYDEVTAGLDIGILLQGIDRETATRGRVLAKPGTVKAYKKFEAAAYFLTKGEGGRATSFKSDYEPQFYIGTASVTGKIKLSEGKEVVELGKEQNFVVELINSVAMEKDDDFIIREGNKTIAGGRITKIIE